MDKEGMTEIVLSWFSKNLSPNARTHWSKRAKAVKAHRTEAAWKAKLAPKPTGKEIEMDVIFHPPDSRRRDRTNMEASMKAAYDGLSDAWGIDDRHFAPRYYLKEPVKGGKVVVRYG